MPKFSIRYPYLIIVICLMVCVLGVASIVRMPVDLFPAIKIPVVVVATFFSGMPPEQMENDITGPFERFFTLSSGIDHIESRSLPGVSLVKVYFQPGTNADAAVSSISNLAMAQLRRLPPGTLPPVVLKFDASSLPVCLITLKGEGLNETQLRDLGQFVVRNQVANVPGASVPQPFGGRFRQIMVYVDPLKLEAHQLSVMDVVRSVNQSNLILPAGDVKIGPIDYSLYTNSQLQDVDDINRVPLKMVNGNPVMVADVGYAKDGSQIQTNIVRIDGQPSVYTPVLKQGGDTNTIAVVSGIRKAISDLVDVPKSLVCNVVFDQSVFVKTAIENLIHEGATGLILTGLMILLFLGDFRATLAVFLSIPLSAFALFIMLSFGDNSINSMVLGGLALAFSRLIDDSVVVLENIFRHLELGESPEAAAEIGAVEVQLPVLASTLTTAIVFFPVVFLYGVSRFLFTALALGVVLSLCASYFAAMSVVPLFCAKLIKGHKPHGAREQEEKPSSKWARFNAWFNRSFHAFLDRFDKVQNITLGRPAMTVAVIFCFVLLGGCTAYFLGLSYFPRTDPGQFVINFKAPTGTRIEVTDQEAAKVENLIRRIIPADELHLIVSNLGTTADFSAIYTSNSASHTGFIQVALSEDHKLSSFDYMDRVRKAMKAEAPELSAYFQSGGLVDAVLNLGQPAPIDIQVSGSSLKADALVASEIAAKVKAIPGVSDVLIPQDIDAPSLQLQINRLHASEMGLSEQEVVGNVITALTSDQMIAPSYWIDPKTGNDYMLTVQYPEPYVKTLSDLTGIPLRSTGELNTTRLDTVANVIPLEAPTEVDHFQLRRVIDIFVAPLGEELGHIQRAVNRIIENTKLPEGIRVKVHGSVQSMNSSFTSFGLGLMLALVLVYLILVAQFKSFMDPFLILLAVPPGLAGVIFMLVFSGTTLNIMSLMGVVMMAGIVVSNSILIVEFTHRLMEDGMELREAAQFACRVRLRPILMTSLATIIGLLPMALKLGTGSEAYAPLARSIIGGLLASLMFTVFLVPAAFTLVYRKRRPAPPSPPEGSLAPPHGPRIPAEALVLPLLAFSIFLLPKTANAADPAPIHLTLQKAESIALRHAPEIAQAYFNAAAAGQVVREVRAGLFPQVTGNVIGVADTNEISRTLGLGDITRNTTRIGAGGGLNNSGVYSRESNGILVSQLITDFGRTGNYVEAARLNALSAAQRTQLARAQVLLMADQAYFQALEGNALIRVANETISTRQVVVDLTNALVESKLRSELDSSLALVALEEARLLLLQADARQKGAQAQLSAALGFRYPQQFTLDDDTIKTPNEQAQLAALLTEAFRNRPEAIAVRYRRDAALQNAIAEKKARLPVVSFIGAYGRTPAGDDLVRETYAVAGVNVAVPILDGGRISARSSEATLTANAVSKEVEALEDEIARDVNLAWLNVTITRKKIEVTASLLASATKAMDLAKARYQSGVASFVELSQAELGMTQAEIENATAKYEYQIGLTTLDFQAGALKYVKPLPSVR
jgi:hydrophobic/amphiphilic exporter-1 (mainly G- bacteria), HAE1 family